MSFSYRTSDLAKWGVGLLRKLHAVEIDLNWWSAEQRLTALETAPSPPPAIDHFESIGTSFYVHFADLSVMGPYDLPVVHYTKRGPWAPFTDYAVLDTFTENGVTYEVLLDHESAATFDAGATDGSGHDLYLAMFEPPGNSLPTGGAVGMVLTKSATADFLATWSWKFPDGGTTGKFLRQASNTQDDVEWADLNALEISFTPVTGSILTSTTVAAAIEELSSGGGVLASGVTYHPTTASGLSATNVQDAIDELATSGGGSIGKQTLWIPASAMTPALTFGATSGVFETSTFKRVIKTLDFNDGDVAQFEISMPKSWDTSTIITAKFFWSHSSTSTDYDVTWKLEGGSVYETAPLDADLNWQDSITDTGGVTDALYVSDELVNGIEIIDDVVGNPATYGSLTIFNVTRSSGTLAVAARLHGIQLYYTTNAGTDN